MRTFHVLPSNFAFFVLVVLDVLALSILVLIVGGKLVHDPKGAPAKSSEPAVTTAAQTTARTTTALDAASPRATTSVKGAAATKSPAASATAPVRLVVRATRGDCWVSATVGDRNGKVLYAGVLAQGDQVKVSSQRIWLELGAGANVDVLVDGKPRVVNTGTSAVLLS